MSTVALKSALELLHVPTNVRLARRAPLPNGAAFLLRIAVEDREAIAEAVQITGRPQEVTHRAACFFIEQVLFSPDADNYRILGAERSASQSELREHMALLLRWLHPDVNADAEANSHRTNLARRVVSAWEQLKTTERRRAYDASLPDDQPSQQQRRNRRKAKLRSSTVQQRHLHSAEDSRQGSLPIRKKNLLMAAFAFLFRPRRRRDSTKLPERR